jgi:hypothetical protein
MEIRDIRKQNRKIIIELTQTGGKMEVDDFVNNVVKELEIIHEEKAKPDNIQMIIILE